jgi:transcription elongation factor SPT6
MRDLIDNQAELDSEEDDESFDDEAGDRPRKERDGRIEDSSDEEEDDDDEEEARKVSLTCYVMKEDSKLTAL